MKVYIKIQPVVSSDTRFEALVYFDDSYPRVLDPEYTTLSHDTIGGAVYNARVWLRSIGLTLSEETVLCQGNLFTVEATRVLKRDDVLDALARLGIDLEDMVSDTIVQFVQHGEEIRCTLINPEDETEEITVVDE